MPVVIVQRDGGSRRPDSEFPHLAHLLLTVISCGLWLPVWVGLWVLHLLMGGKG